MAYILFRPNYNIGVLGTSMLYNVGNSILAFTPQVCSVIISMSSLQWQAPIGFLFLILVTVGINRVRTGHGKPGKS